MTRQGRDQHKAGRGGATGLPLPEDCPVMFHLARDVARQIRKGLSTKEGSERS